MMKTRCSIKKYKLLSLVLIALFLLVGCSKMHEKKYYADINNFITDEAVVDNVIYNEKEGYIVLWLSEIDEAYQCSDFIIKGNNVDLVLENGILDKIEIGDTITYTSAPRIFGNGYFMPIIEISVSGEELLNVDDGYKNLMDLY